MGRKRVALLSFFFRGRFGLGKNERHFGSDFGDLRFIDLDAEMFAFIGVAVFDAVLDHGAAVRPDSHDDTAEVGGVGASIGLFVKVNEGAGKNPGVLDYLFFGLSHGCFEVIRAIA